MDLNAPLAKEKLETILAELRERLAELYGERLVKLILYGSQARGDAEPGSDIDVLVVLRGAVESGEEIERTGEAIASVSLKYDEVISRIFISEKQFEEENSAFLTNAFREGIALYDA